MKILIATNNPGKHKGLIHGLGIIPGIEFLPLSKFPPSKDCEETGTSFEANALLKAQFFANTHQIPTIGEDSGFILEAFPKKFGLKSKREIQAKDDIEWTRLFLEMMENTSNRKATFYSAIAFYNPQNQTKHITIGETKGAMSEFPQTPLEPGIPASALFTPNGETEVYSAMNKTKWKKVSHRGKATAKMAQFLQTLSL